MRVLTMVRVTALAGCLGLLPAAFALPVSVQDFEDGSTQGWTAGGGPGGAVPLFPPAVATGGPAGPADQHLRIRSIGGSGAGSQLTAINRDGWDGDYLAAGLTQVTADLRNFGPGDLYVRLVLIDFDNQRHASTGAVFLASGGGWTDGVFSLAAADLIAGQGAVADLLASVTELRIWAAGDPDALYLPGFSSPGVVAELGVDNLTPNVFDGGGGTVAAPPTAALALLGLLAVAGARPRRASARPLRP